MKYAYPARFFLEDDGRYSVLFVDMELATYGDNLVDAAFMAQDALSGWLAVSLEYGDPLPRPSNPAFVKPEGAADFVSLVYAEVPDDVSQKELASA
jgi:predicted RNase H-like HicB family nuclease